MNNNYNFVGKICVNEIINFVSNLNNSEWEEEQIRQKLFEPHKHTQTIPILWDLDSLSGLQVAKKRKYFEVFQKKFIKEIENQLYNFYGDGRILRILITKLKSNKKILPHVDIGDGLLMSKRIHIPLITSKNVLFYVDNEEKNMKVGEMWEINNQKVHFVENNSDQDRVHLIVDYYLN